MRRLLAVAALAAAAGCGAPAAGGMAGARDAPSPAPPFATREASPPVSRLAWLSGCWTRTHGETRIEETWSAAAGGTMLGLGRTVRGERTLDWEHLRIEERDGALVYVASPSGQRTTEFGSVHASDTLAVFENPTHDFPQRILYRPGAADSLWARIEGERQGVPRGVDFRMTRAPCPGGAATTVVVVRHAERAAHDPRDPDLSPAGHARAEALAAALAHLRVTAIYVTPYRRTHQTAAPLASGSGAPVIERPAAPGSEAARALADEILARHPGEAVLVVGHSNTVADLVSVLSGTPVAALTDADYDHLYLVVMPVGGTPRLVRTRFGAGG